jgi:hypothetical protein
MNIYVKRVGQYADVRIKHDDATINLGLLNTSEVAKLACQLIESARFVIGANVHPENEALYEIITQAENDIGTLTN